jgi:hypothetical protein
VPVVERGHQSGVRGEQHRVAEHVARHVADTDHGEVLAAGVVVHLAEVPLDGLPRTPRGDAHPLVVVAGRPARGERVAQPEPVRRGNLVGDVGERGGALVGRHHQVRVVGVVAYHVVGRQDLPADEVVGDVQQRGDELAVAGHSVGPVGLLDHESALGPHRHDDGVLHQLRLDQAQDLGAEVLPPVRPADAAAGHRAEAQVHPLEQGRVDEDLEPGPGGRQVGDGLGVELERHVRLRPLRAVRAAGDALEERGAAGGHDQ